MIKLEAEKIEPLPENLQERQKALYRLYGSVAKSLELKGDREINVQFFDGDNCRIMSINASGKNQEGAKIDFLKTYYRNGQLSEAYLQVNGKNIEGSPIFFFENGMQQQNPYSKMLKERLQRDN